MTVCFALVEGQTELDFLKYLLKPHLAGRGITLAIGLPAKTGGGTPKWDPTLRDIQGKLMERSVDYVTIMFDLYGLPLDWPGRQYVRDKGLKYTEAVQHIEHAIADAVSNHLGKNFNINRFIPYIQQHEFEALLFSGPSQLAETIGEPELAKEFESIRNKCGGCEQINDSEQTAPSKRIESLAPAYQKRTAGIRSAMKIGLPVMRNNCPHFKDWLIKLENLTEI